MVSIHSRVMYLPTEIWDRASVFSTDRLSHDELAIDDKNDDLDADWTQALSLTRKTELIAVDSSECVRFGCRMDFHRIDNSGVLASEPEANYLTHFIFVIPPCHPPCLRPPFPPLPPSTPP